MAIAGKFAAIVSVSILLMAAAIGIYLSQTATPAHSSSTTESSRSGFGSTSVTTETTRSESASTAVTTVTSYSGLASTVETANSSLGLKLVLSVNSTTIPSQDTISMTATVLNTRPTVNNLTASDYWAIQGLSSGPCDGGDNTNKMFSPVGFGVFRGSYGLNNLSSAGRPLGVWAMVSCPASFVFNGTQVLGYLRNITSYSLSAHRENNLGYDRANYSGYYAPASPPSCNSQACRSTPQTFVRGVFPTRLNPQATIYAANGTGFYNSLGSSLPSTYTLVAGDEWGQIILLHFGVVQSTNLPKVGSFLASSGACAENGNPVPCIASQFSQAFIFNCASEAATASGCVRQVSSGVGNPASPLTNYTITVRYPYLNQPGEPAWANCMFSVSGDTTSPWGYCFMVNSTSFALSFHH